MFQATRIVVNTFYLFHCLIYLFPIFLFSFFEICHKKRERTRDLKQELKIEKCIKYNTSIVGSPWHSPTRGFKASISKLVNEFALPLDSREKSKYPPLATRWTLVGMQIARVEPSRNAFATFSRYKKSNSIINWIVQQLPYHHTVWSICRENTKEKKVIFQIIGIVS